MLEYYVTAIELLQYSTARRKSWSHRIETPDLEAADRPASRSGERRILPPPRDSPINARLLSIVASTLLLRGVLVLHTRQRYPTDLDMETREILPNPLTPVLQRENRALHSSWFQLQQPLVSRNTHECGSRLQLHEMQIPLLFDS